MPPCRRRCPGPAGPVDHSLRPEPPAPHDEPDFSTGCSPWPHPTTALTRPTTTTANFAQSQFPSFSLLKSSPAQPFPHLPASPHPKHSSNCLVHGAIDSTIATLAARCVAAPTDGCDIPYSTYPLVTPHHYGRVWAGCRAQLSRCQHPGVQNASSPRITVSTGAGTCACWIGRRRWAPSSPPSCAR
jgi:hypothetical protein